MKVVLLLFVSLIVGCVSEKDFSQEEVKLIDAKVAGLEYDLEQIKVPTEELVASVYKLFSGKNKNPRGFKKADLKKSPSGVLYRPYVESEADIFVSALNSNQTQAIEVALSLLNLNDELKRILKVNSDVVQVYYNDRNNVNIIYPPIDVLTQYEPKIEIPSFNFYYLADMKHNPSKKMTWVDEPYVDPAGRGWMISAIAPVYVDDKMEGVVGLDVTLSKLIEKTQPEKGLHYLLMHSNGQVISVSEALALRLELPPLVDHKYLSTVKSDTFKPDAFNLKKSNNKKIRDFVEKVLKEPTATLDGEVLAASRGLKVLPWHLIVFKEYN